MGQSGQDCVNNEAAWKRGAASIASGQIERQAMFMRISGALIRALAVILLVATPSIILPSTPGDTGQIVILVAVLAAIATFAEYASKTPTLIEFREAPPVNRIRFLAVFSCVFFLSSILRGQVAPTTFTVFLDTAGARLAEMIDFPLSPVRLMVGLLPASAAEADISILRTAAGVAYIISILSLAFMVITLRLGRWPLPGRPFNIWTNLPLFNPSVDVDVVQKLRRDAAVNGIFGLTLPFLVPAILQLAVQFVDPISLTNPHTLVWSVTAWAFLPASLIIRGMALSQIANILESKKKRALAKALEDGWVPVQQSA
jgi:hypothetical protein